MDSADNHGKTEHGHEGKSQQGGNVHEHSWQDAGDKKIRNSVFLALLFGFLGLVFLFVSGAEFFSENFLLIAVLLVFLFLIWKYDYILQLKEYERAVVYTFGRARGVVGPGWAFILPPIQSYAKVDLRTTVFDVPPQNVVTKDGVEVKIDALIYLRVKKDKESVLKSVLEVKDYKTASRSYVVALLRDVLGNINLADVVSSIDQIDMTLKAGLEKISDSWGVGVDTVKIQEVKIPETVLQAMHEEKAAAQQKLASFQRAEAHEREISAVRHATENLSDKSLAYYYVKAIEELGKGSSTKFVLPLELTKLVEAFTNKQVPQAQIENFLRSTSAQGVSEKPKKSRGKEKK